MVAANFMDFALTAQAHGADHFLFSVPGGNPVEAMGMFMF